MTTSPAIREAEKRVAVARKTLLKAEADLRSAQEQLNAAQEERFVPQLRAIDWEVLYELGIGGILVRYKLPSDDQVTHVGATLPRRFQRKPGCLISGESDRRTPISDRTMRLLVASGLAYWAESPGHATQMHLTKAGAARISGMTRPSTGRA